MATGTRGGATLSSLAVLAVAAFFSIYALEQRRGVDPGGTAMSARFFSANNLSDGAKVEMAGVAVGQVQHVRLDPKSQVATVAFTIRRGLRLPDDTVASIAAPTMTSDNVLQLSPGTSSHYLSPGATITRTRDPVSLEQQVSNYIFGNTLGSE